jgi:hypothetical protein
MADSKNPLNYVLPAGVLAYVASPDVRQAVRSVVVKGMATAMDFVEKAENASESLRGEFTGIVSDAEKMRQEAKKPPVHIHIDDEETSDVGTESAPA